MTTQERLERHLARAPQVAAALFVAPNATVIGDVELGARELDAQPLALVPLAHEGELGGVARGAHPLDDVGMLRGEVGGFSAIVGEVIKLRLSAVILAKQLPVPVTHGEIRQAFGELFTHRLAIRRATPKDGGCA
jgi:hypothetical protein